MQGTSSLFITDPLDELNPKKDTTILWMQEVFSMGGQILQCEMKDLIYKDQQTFANCSEIKDPITNPQISEAVNQAQSLKDIDYVFMRKDPPVDEDYMNALHLLSQAEAEGAKVINRPSALKNFNEKIFALQFSHWMPDTSVICKEEDFELFECLTTEIQYFACDSGHGGNIINDCLNALKEDSPGFGEMDYEYRWNKRDYKDYLDEPYIQWALDISSYGQIKIENEILIGGCLGLVWDDCKCENCI